MFSATLSRTISLLALTGFLATRAVYSSPLEARDTPTCSSAGVTQPAAGTPIHGGDTIPFGFDSSGFGGKCHPGYTPISVWLLSSQPTSGSLNADHEFSDFLYHFGDYLIDNFARKSGARLVSQFVAHLILSLATLPPMGTPPPSTLNVPDLGAAHEDQDVYIAVVQTEGSCAVTYHPDIVVQISNSQPRSPMVTSNTASRPLNCTTYRVEENRLESLFVVVRYKPYKMYFRHA